MSIVDDLEHAEDAISSVTEALVRTAHNAHLCHARLPFDECRKESCIRARADLLAIGSYCRPSCEKSDDGTWECGEYCGCPGDHDETHGQERSDGG